MLHWWHTLAFQIILLLIVKADMMTFDDGLHFLSSFYFWGHLHPPVKPLFRCIIINIFHGVVIDLIVKLKVFKQVIILVQLISQGARVEVWRMMERRLGL